LQILSPGRASESRLSPPPPPSQSPSLSSIHSFDNVSSPTTSITTDKKRSLIKEPTFRTSLEEDSGTKSIASAFPFHVNIR
jgi:hypothetical protein